MPKVPFPHFTVYKDLIEEDEHKVPQAQLEYIIFHSMLLVHCSILMTSH